jgi:hypothetical protein
MSLQVGAPLRDEGQEETKASALGGIAKASGLDDGISVYRGAIVKGKALGDATQTVSLLGVWRSSLRRAWVYHATRVRKGAELWHKSIAGHS